MTTHDPIYNLPDFEKVKHHPLMEDVVSVLSTMTQKKNPGFFRVIASYFFAKMAASMRAQIDLPISPESIPVNVYAVAMAPSGYGKGYSVNIMERQFLRGFQKRFRMDTFPEIADQTLWKMAIEAAASSGMTEDQEKERLEKQFRRAGPVPFTFDSATPAAVKQIREKLILANCGAINLQIDEIGSNFTDAIDIVPVFLELYDMGLTKIKLIKNTAENERGDDVDGKTPTNALLFGTPSKLLDGGRVEESFYSNLEAGLARRGLFGWGTKELDIIEQLSPQERLKRLTQTNQSNLVKKISTHFTTLSDPAKHEWTMTCDNTVTLAYLMYQDECVRQASKLGEYAEMRRAELEHRHSKALKLAGAFAFVDESIEITIDHFESAIKLVEESGIAFQALLTREKPYVKLAKYLAEVGSPQTHADLNSALPFYSSANSRRSELMDLACGWGYKNHIVIRKTFENNIQLFEGESLQKTNIDEIQVSYSDHQAYRYQSELAPFSKLHVLTQTPDMHWCNHQFDRGHRSEANVIPGFNMLVADIDGTAKIEFVKEEMKDHTFLLYTTKSHTPDTHRFRMLFPISYTLKMDQEDYHTFMDSFLAWLPFETDPTSRQRCKKWLSCDTGTYFYSEGEMLNPLPFIPKTSQNEEFQKNLGELQSLDNLERWFAQRMQPGNRNNQMIKYALALVDSGMGYNQVENAILNFNSRISNSLSQDELRNTVLVTVARKMHSRP